MVGAPYPCQTRTDAFLSGNLATMAPGLLRDLAAKSLIPDRQCLAFVGDGGFSMLMADFATA